MFEVNRMSFSGTNVYVLTGAVFCSSTTSSVGACIEKGWTMIIAISNHVVSEHLISDTDPVTFLFKALFCMSPNVKLSNSLWKWLNIATAIWTTSCPFGMPTKCWSFSSWFPVARLLTFQVLTFEWQVPIVEIRPQNMFGKHFRELEARWSILLETGKLGSPTAVWYIGEKKVLPTKPRTWCFQGRCDNGACCRRGSSIAWPGVKSQTSKIFVQGPPDSSEWHEIWGCRCDLFRGEIKKWPPFNEFGSLGRSWCKRLVQWSPNTPRRPGYLRISVWNHQENVNKKPYTPNSMCSHKSEVYDWMSPSGYDWNYSCSNAPSHACFWKLSMYESRAFTNPKHSKKHVCWGNLQGVVIQVGEKVTCKHHRFFGNYKSHQPSLLLFAKHVSLHWLPKWNPHVFSKKTVFSLPNSPNQWVCKNQQSSTFSKACRSVGHFLTTCIHSTFPTTTLGGGFIFFNVHPCCHPYSGKMNPFWRICFQTVWTVRIVHRRHPAEVCDRCMPQEVVPPDVSQEVCQLWTAKNREKHQL